MMLLRKILLPFSVLYGLITSIRNFLFDKGILKSYSFDLPVIAVGNLSVGGTGKTPLIEYLIRLLSPEYKVATLSRGYKRKSEGFVLADENSDAALLGDEPFQFYKKFPNINVAVDADRKNGIERLLEITRPEIILLDDAYQHRKVKAGLYILLTAYGDLYANDLMLPAGNLRESRNGAERAKIIIVTKCPPNLPVKEQDNIEKRLKIDSDQRLFFTSISYDTFVFSEETQVPVFEIKDVDKILLAGIAKPEPFFAYLQSENDVIMTFPDHHHFTEKDIAEIKNKAQDKIIITTEKDFVRLKDSLPKSQLFYLPIRSVFISETSNKQFCVLINNYIKQYKAPYN